MTQPDILKQLGLKVVIAFVKAMTIEHFPSNEVTAVCDELPEPIFSVVMDTQTTEDKIDATIQSLTDFYRQHHSTWSWIIGPLSKPEPSLLATHLERHDFYLDETYPGMHFDLAQRIPESDVALDIREVDDLSEWIIPVREAFPPSQDNGEGFRQLNARLSHGPGTMFRHYVGYSDGVPVAAGTLFSHGELAMIHNISTRPTYQRRQFGTAMVTRLLKDAQRRRVTHCFLDASESGKNVYNRIGFNEYCQQMLYKPK